MVSSLLLVLLFSLFLILTRVLLLRSWARIVNWNLRDLTIEWLWITVVRHLLVKHVWWNLTVVLVVDTNGWHWLRGQIFVWVEATESHNISQVRDGEHGHSVLNW